jgi:hypothetical protein
MRILIPVILLSHVAVSSAAEPSGVMGNWGNYDQASGKCTPDSVGVTLTAGKLSAIVGGHEAWSRVVGKPVCKGNRCTVSVPEMPKPGTWTWTFQSPDTAVIRGNFPHDMVEGGVMDFSFPLKKGCP